MADIYLHLNGEQKGPYPAEQVRAMLAAAQITPDTLAWHEGLSGWVRVSAILEPTPAPAPGAPPPPVPEPRKGVSGWLIALMVVGGLIVLSLPCCCGVLLGPITNGIEKAKESAALQQERAIAMAMFAYANDHNGNYPDAPDAPASGSVVTIGNVGQGAATSTEVFQKLLDGKYVADPGLFYLVMPGKVRPVSSVLAANNVCYDVTAGLTANSPRGIPLIYTTGFKFDFGRTIKITRDGISPFPSFIGFYTGGKGVAFKLGPDGVISIAPPFEIFGTGYRQLRP